jgi:hypothetical protein
LFWLFVLVVVAARHESLVTALVVESWFRADNSAVFKLPPLILRTPNRLPSKPKNVIPALAGSSGEQV